jgi:hypothetical protein
MQSTAEQARAPEREGAPRNSYLVRPPLTTEAVILAVLMTLAFSLFLLIEPTPRWLALFGTVVAALGLDGVLRGVHARMRLRDDPASAPERGAPDVTAYLFLPSLFALAVPVFAEHHVRGYWALAAGVGSGAAFAAIVSAAIASIRAEEHVVARLIAAAATYFVAFAVFGLSYAFDLRLRDAVLAVGVTSTLLAVELLRDDEVDPIETLVFAGITGLVLAEARWLLQYMPIDGGLAALTLVLLFYFVAGVVHSYITRQLTPAVAAEYGAVAATGIAVLAGIRAAGIA